jgi:sugar/nucleoside kinase (ribokinase family)
MSERRWVVVCGHICLDVIPTFGGSKIGLADLLVPGKLVDVGPAVIATGGAVSNTGLALHRLGVPARLMGKVGDDLFGHAILEVVRRHDPALAEGMIVSPEAASSYTIVVNPPGVDRVFLHCPGANDSFGADDVPYHTLSDVRLFHFGYPPLMRRMYQDGGSELESLFRRVKATGTVASLDMARPDPASAAGRAPWAEILTRVLPHVDLFLPSLDETLFMLDRKRFDAFEAGRLQVDGALLSDLAAQLLDLGAGVVALKLGAEGLYLRTGAAEALAALGEMIAVEAWAGRELLAPCFGVDVVGTTGSGDCTVAGFLAGLGHGLSPEDTMTSAVAVGACSVEAADATSGVRTWEEVQRRVGGGWARREAGLSLPGWEWDGRVWRGQNDGR